MVKMNNNNKKTSYLVTSRRTIAKTNIRLYQKQQKKLNQSNIEKKTAYIHWCPIKRKDTIWLLSSIILQKSHCITVTAFRCQIILRLEWINNLQYFVYVSGTWRKEINCEKYLLWSSSVTNCCNVLPSAERILTHVKKRLHNQIYKLLQTYFLPSSSYSYNHENR